MAKGSGGTRGGGASARGGMSSRASELADKYLGGISDPTLKKELAEGLEAFDKEFGSPEGVTVKLSSGMGTAAGAANGLGEIKINSGYQSGALDKSDAKHTMIHELTHTFDKTDTHHSKNISGIKMQGWKPVGVLKSENKGFDKKLTAAYKHFKSHYGSSDTKAIGRYALKSKHEFFAESLASHLTGTQNKYTTFAYNLAKSMK